MKFFDNYKVKRVIFYSPKLDAISTELLIVRGDVSKKKTPIKKKVSTLVVEGDIKYHTGLDLEEQVDLFIIGEV